MTIDPTVVLGAITALASALGYAARRIYTDLRIDRDYWRDLALKGTDLADKAATLATRKRFDG